MKRANLNRLLLKDDGRAAAGRLARTSNPPKQRAWMMRAGRRCSPTCREPRSSNAVTKMTDANAPDVVFLDVQMPGMAVIVAIDSTPHFALPPRLPRLPRQAAARATNRTEVANCCQLVGKPTI